MKVAIACGGTGGHLFPGLAVADVLLERGHEVLVFISEKEIDTLATRGRTDLRLEKLPSVGMPSVFSPAIAKFFVRFFGSYKKCRQIFDSFQPNVVLGMGGFTSTAPILAGRMKKIPTFIHESNAIPGKANRITARLTSIVLLGFEECAGFFPKAKTEITGTPVRQSLLAPVDRQNILEKFGLRENVRTLLIMGGSQGAQGLNRAASSALSGFGAEDLQVIHFTGKLGEDSVRTEYQNQGRAAYVAAFHHEMQEAYAVADLAISRSGAASLTELSYFGIPSILIPYPFAAEDHQTLNAQIFVKAGASILCKEENAIAGDLAEVLRNLLAKPELIASMAAKSKLFTRQKAAAIVADILEKYSESASHV
jgi:UDP-N-acetylglucosamine--N-acetylmuramyl-(pentapeptide) pyrophosphoryl-undecaprenol N-acetylglucosamine transferase